jgi:iron complex outermembrane receptor protein
VARVNTAFRNTFFLTAGLRLERDNALVGTTRVTTLPMLGGAVVRDHGDVTLKLRAAYGEAIRPVQGAIRELALGGRRSALVAYDLAPERQAGIEAGADLFVGRALALRVTRFDQTATDLIQSVAVPVRRPAVPGRAGPGGEYAPAAIAYQLQNVGEIDNRGWEMQGSLDLGRLTLASTLSLVDSRVRMVGSGYTGDLRAGDRMLDVPARTASLSGSWAGAGWLGALTVTRADDWVGYDRLALAGALTSGGAAPRALAGDQLRSFWRSYGGVTRVSATFTRDVIRGLSLVLAGDNLLGQQRGEPDNVTVVPGRTITAGFRARF